MNADCIIETLVDGANIHLAGVKAGREMAYAESRPRIARLESEILRLRDLLARARDRGTGWGGVRAMKTFGERLRFAIEQADMTMRSFAARAGLVDESHLHSFLSGRTRPSLIVLERIACALPHVDLRWLVCGRKR